MSESIANFNSYKIPIGSGGFNYSKNQLSMESNFMVPDSYNINLFPSYVECRGGSTILTMLPERSQIVSIYCSTDEESDPFTLCATSTGKIYYNNILGYSYTSGFGYGTYAAWNKYVIIGNGLSKPLYFDSETKVINVFPDENCSQDWLLYSAFPSVFYTYGKSNSMRMFAIGTDLKKNILYYSNLYTTPSVPDFSAYNGGLITINLHKNDRLTGLFEFGDRLFITTLENVFLFDDTSLDISKWSIVPVQWSGGALSHQTIVKIENDVFILTKDGTIYSVSTVMSYGDYKVSSITDANSIDNYIDENIVSSLLHISHAQYDETLRCIKYFLPKNGAYNNVSLVYFIDKGPKNGWSIHKNDLYSSGYNASCSSKLILDDGTTYIVTGDYNGYIWVLETDDIYDEGNPFEIKITTPWINFDDPRTTKRFIRGFLEVGSESNLSINTAMNIRNKSGKISYVEIGSDGDVYDEALWDSAIYAGGLTVAIKRYEIQRIGVDIQFIFTFSAPTNSGSSLWDYAIYDEDYYCEEDLQILKFRILNNIIDASTISRRMTV